MTTATYLLTKGLFFHADLKPPENSSSVILKEYKTNLNLLPSVRKGIFFPQDSYDTPLSFRILRFPGFDWSFGKETSVV